MAAGEDCEFESWEEMEDSGVLDKKIEQIKVTMTTSIQKGLSNNTNNTGKAEIVFLAEDGRTRYVPPEPTVKILKRPSSINSTHNAGGDGFIINGEKPKQPIKTLQQREMEYAEARLRILGEAQSPEERPALLESIRKIQNKIDSTNDASEPNLTLFAPHTLNNCLPIQTHTTLACANNNGGSNLNVITNYAQHRGAGHYANHASIQPHHYQQTNVPLGYYMSQYHHANVSPMRHTDGGLRFIDVSPSAMGSIITTMPNSIILSSSVSHNAIIRQPRGPDGTKGFMSRTLR